jgi:hypothetical protein
MARDGAVRPVKGTEGKTGLGHALDEGDNDGADEYKYHRLATHYERQGGARSDRPGQ